MGQSRISARTRAAGLRWAGYVALLALLSGCGDVKFGTISDQSKSDCDMDFSDECSPSPPSVSESFTAASTTKVDVLFVVDTSGSMEVERAQLGRRLANFISGLSGLDWQICVTTTDPYEQNGDLLPFGVPASSRPSQRVLTASTSGYEQAFLDRIVNAGRGTGDEQGIHSLNLAVGRNHPDCFRRDAALAAVVLSDEDERSVGGHDEYRGDDQFEELEDINKPQNLVARVRSTLGQQKIFTGHSIVVKTGDKACYDSQNASAAGGRAAYGTWYEELSRITGGQIGDICANDYANELSKFAEGIRQSLSSVTLKCAPLGVPQVTLVPERGDVRITSQGNKILFSPALPSGTRVDVNYTCPGDALI